MNYVSLSTQNTTNALLFGTRWSTGVDMTNITYSFPGLSSTWVDYTNPGEPYQGFTSFNAYEQQAVRNTLLAWSSVANLSFTEVADDTGGNGTIRIAYTSHLMDANQLGYAYLPNDLASGGDVWLNAGLQGSLFQSLEPGTIGNFTLLHELGHTLGLKHPGEASAYSSATLSTLEDTIFNTAMSSNAMPGVPLTLAGNIDRLPSTPMSYDIDDLAYPKGATLSHQLNWSHIVELLKIDDTLERGFYEQQCVHERWSVRELIRQKESALFLRLAASKDKTGILQLAAQGQIVEQPADLLREPYVFEFLKIPEPWQVTVFFHKSGMHLQGGYIS